MEQIIRFKVAGTGSCIVQGIIDKDGTGHNYTLPDFYKCRRLPEEQQEINFYRLNQDGYEVAGTTNEIVIRILIDRLQKLNANFSCRENSIAITKLEEALMWLNKRTEDRIERNVEGQHKA